MLDLETGVATPLETHGDRVLAVALDKTGTIAATGDEDGAIRVGGSQHEVDLQLSKGFRAGPVRFVLIGTVLNALGSEQVTGECAHISGCGSDPDGNPINMGDPDDWQIPRRYEVGFRVEF